MHLNFLTQTSELRMNNLICHADIKAYYVD